jgi:3-mercaptopyruvate sulfurtransferase SseA
MEMPFNGEPAIYRLIDVRGGRDYLGRQGFGAEKPIPNMDATNIPWKEFFTKGLRPDPAIKERLQKAGIEPHHRIIVLDQAGVSSAAVTLALRGLGYDKAGNYAGGLTDLMSSYGR